MTELLPCPFCGAAMKVREHSAFHPGNDCWLASLDDCLPLELGECEYAAWNRRAAPEAPSDMKSEYIVRDDDGNISWSEWPEGPESFKTFHAAERRAKELAALAPGKAIGIYELVAETTVPIGAVATGRKYPREHYK
jgi:hypothetical protein